MKLRILITGSSGLVGAALSSALMAMGYDVRRLDLRDVGTARGDVRDRRHVFELGWEVDGIIHLAAVSRVIWGEQDPALCHATNIDGLRNVLDALVGNGRRPWLIFASSREIYGQPTSLPANEDAPAQPVNVYGRTKVKGEQLVACAQEAGLRACTIRLSNVFGSVLDHADRVVPAFARAAALGADLRVDGPDHTFDFTHIDDVTRGITALVEHLQRGATPPPPIHFVSGKPTTLRELATLAIRLGDAGSSIRLAPPRDFDVARFWGDPSRAREILGWQPNVPLEDGLARLIRQFREEEARRRLKEVVP
jgi:nucleoside-diphosphate-sugar epimerase